MEHKLNCEMLEIYVGGPTHGTRMIRSDLLLSPWEQYIKKTVKRYTYGCKTLLMEQEGKVILID